MELTNFSVLNYSTVGGHFNIGDYVQSLAAANFLPKVDQYINREHLNTYIGPPTKLICNGWFMHQPENWPPSSKINPLFLSFHINRPFVKRMLSPEGIEYLKRKSPIGCRDLHTAAILKENGIDAYFSGCLTTTLERDRYATAPRKKVILFVDPMHAVPSLSSYLKLPKRALLSHVLSGNIAKSISKKQTLKKLIEAVSNYEGYEHVHLKNSIPAGNMTTRDKFDQASSYLKKLGEASLVITSRIHCALPCLALGTPVIFVKHGQKSESNMQRFHGLIDNLNVLDLDGDCSKYGIDANFITLEQISNNTIIDNPDKWKKHATELRNKVHEFIKS